VSDNGSTTPPPTAANSSADGSVNGQVEVLAAGGLISRTAADGQLEVALVHRPKYGDWSLPKGKLEAGESFQEAAIREVEEETGIRCGLDRELGQAMYQDAQGRAKTVRYWLMTPLHGDFTPNDEVDQLEWVSLDEARQRLSYDFDRELMTQLDAARSDGRVNPPRYELYRRKWSIFAVTMVGLFMALIDVTIVNISIPTLLQEFGTGISTVSWVLNAYNITVAVVLISMGRLADQFGRRKFFIIGLSIFTFASLLCAIAPSVGALIGFRVIQGLGAAVLVPLALAITAMIFPPKQRGLGLSLLAVVANSAAALGPLVGGLILEVSTWNWIFFINVPIGIAGVIWALRVMPETYDLTATRKVDLIGMVTLGGAIATLTYALIYINDRGIDAPSIYLMIAASVVLNIAFVISQKRGKHPMLTPGIMSNKQFLRASGTFVLFGMGVIGVLFLLVLGFQTMWHLAPLTSAFATLPIPVCGLIVAPMVARNADRVAPRVVAVASLAVMAVGLLWLSFMPAAPDYWKVVAPLVLIGCGMGGAFPSINVAAMGSVSGQELGLGAGIVNSARQLGFGLGIALLVAVFATTFDSRAHDQRRRADGFAKALGVHHDSRHYLLERAFQDPNDDEFRPFFPQTTTGRDVQEIANEAARDGYSWAFRVAALCVLLGIPLALTMRMNPQQAQAHARARAAQAAAATG
jgi:EmrB/QacA subfamily drug resistance transporter